MKFQRQYTLDVKGSYPMVEQQTLLEIEGNFEIQNIRSLNGRLQVGMGFFALGFGRLNRHGSL
jgi:hypothetical protein